MVVRYHRHRADGSLVDIALTERADGNFHLDAPQPDLDAARASVMPGRWAVVRQVHGADVAPADPEQRPEADGVFTSEAYQPVAVQGADCAPVALFGPTGPLGVVHAGWRGLAAGIIETMVETLAASGAAPDSAIVGPLIGPECYAFGSDDLDEVARLLGDEVRSTTASGEAALDLAAGIRVACARVGISSVEFLAGCPGCTWDGFSHRVRRDPERHALAARLVPPGHDPDGGGPS